MRLELEGVKKKKKKKTKIILEQLLEVCGIFIASLLHLYLPPPPPRLQSSQTPQ